MHMLLDVDPNLCFRMKDLLNGVNNLDRHAQFTSIWVVVVYATKAQH